MRPRAIRLFWTLSNLPRVHRHHVAIPSLPGIQHIRPLLHHLGAVGQIVSVVVRTPHDIGFRVRELALDPVGRKAHFVQPRAARRSGGVRAVLPGPVQYV